MIRAAIIENRFEADLIQSALDEEGLDFIIRTFQDTAYDGLYVTQKGYAYLLVNEADEKRVKAIVEEIRSAVKSGQMEPPESGDESAED